MVPSTKFTQSDIQKITEAQKLIQELQKKQSLIYDTLLVNLPTLKKEEESQIFNFVFNDYSHVLELKNGELKIKKINL